MLGWNEYVKMFVAVLALLDPLMATLIFVDLTSTESRPRRASIAFLACGTAAMLLIMSVIIGEMVLKLFGISLHAFKVAGGLLLLLMSISMLQARIGTIKQTPEEFHEAEDKEAIAVVPLAIPLMAGPGTISAMIMYSSKSTEISHKFVLSCVAVFLMIVVYITMRMGKKISRTLGKTGIHITTRLMGLLLAAISVEFIADGLKGLFHNLR